MPNFWKELKKPIMILAPMEDVTDTVFRQIVKQAGTPDVFFTEFTSVEGICSGGKQAVSHRLKFDKSERPLVAQIWGINPEHFKQTAELLVKMGFDGIDLNFGCPERSVLKQGACSAMINTPELAAKIIQATKEGAGDLPVSVKTRIGFKEIQTEEWLGFLLKQDIAALTVHGRTVKEMSEVPAHWDEIGEAVKLRDQIAPNTLVFGNGDVLSMEDAYSKVKEYGVDGIMVGRGIFKNPWLFNKAIDLNTVTIDQRIALLLDHVRLYDEVWGQTKNFQVLKKFFKIYINGFDGAAELRAKLMETKTRSEVEEIILQYTKPESA